MIKKIVTLFLLNLGLFTLLNAQTSQTRIEFRYDAAGNRYLKKAIVINPGIDTDKAGADTTLQDTLKETEPLLSEQLFDDDSKNLSIHIFPNPVYGVLTVAFKGNEVLDGIKMSLISQQGSEMLPMQQVLCEQQLNVSSFAAGVYYLKVLMPSGEKTFKIIKN